MPAQFQRLASLLFSRIMGGEPPAGYIEEVDRLNQACGAWHAEHGGVALILPDLQSGVLVTGDLCLADQYGMCPDDRSRAMIEWVDERTGHTATLLMLQICYVLQQLTLDARVQHIKPGEA